MRYAFRQWRIKVEPEPVPPVAIDAQSLQVSSRTIGDDAGSLCSRDSDGQLNCSIRLVSVGSPGLFNALYI